MRVVLVTKPLTAPWDDSAKLLPRALAEAAGDAEFHVFVTRGDTAPWPAHVRATPLAAGGGYRTGWRLRWELARGVAAAARSADLLHFFFQPHPAATRFARFLTAFVRRPAVHTVTSVPRGERPWRLLFADRTVALSRATASQLARDGAEPPRVVPPALPDEPPPAHERAERARQAAGVEGRFALYPGDYEFSGGHALLLEAWRREPRLPSLVLAGRDKTPAARHGREATAARARQLGLGGRVRVLGRVDDMAGLVAAADFVVFPAESLYAKTDLPLVLLEAWRAGVPVAVSDLGPLEEAVAGAGLVLPADAQRWVDGARALAERRSEWAEAGRRRLEERFSARAQAAAYLAVYRELWSARSAAGRQRGNAA